jgi:hypothetical protein
MVVFSCLRNLISHFFGAKHKAGASFCYTTKLDVVFIDAKDGRTVL